MTRFMHETRPNPLFMREMRNMIEHPRRDAFVKVSDFQISPSMELVPPSIEVVTINAAPRSGSLESFMVQVTDELVSIGEMLMVLLCGANANSFYGFPLVVVELPPSHRPTRNPHQRFSWGIEMNGEVRPLG